MAACCRTSCSTWRRRCGTSRGRRSTAASRTSWSSGSSTDRDYTGKQPGKPTYDSIDVGQYLQDHGQRHAAACSCCTSAPIASPRRRRTTDDQEEARASRRSGGDGDSSEDTRLILVTDLGFIVKQAKDGTRDVFVQSIRTGAPVDGARVELVGGNGQPVLAATTEPTGRARAAGARPDSGARSRR